MHSAVGRGFNVLIEGDRGAGKTSLLRALIWQHHNHESGGGTWVYVRAAGQVDTTTILHRVLVALHEDDIDPDPGPNERVDELIQGLADRAAQGRVCVLLDDVDPRVGNQLFGVLRDELWEAGAQWVVTVNTSDSPVLRRPPADAFFETVVRLNPLPAQEARELLERRIGMKKVNGQLTGKATEVIDALAAGGGQPRDLIERARHVDENSDPASILAAGDEIRRILGGLSRPANMLYAEIRHREPISASDADVQQAMGWTRPRLTQVLGELEDAGLVEGAEQPRSGPGRPKKVFRVLSPFERRIREASHAKSRGA